MPTLKRKPKIHIKKRNGKNTQRVYRGGELGVLTKKEAKDLFVVSSGDMKTLLEIKKETKYDPNNHDGFRILALNKEIRNKIEGGISYRIPSTSDEITNDAAKVEHFLQLLTNNKGKGYTKNQANTELHADMKVDNLKRALAYIRLMIYNMEIQAGGANLENLEKDIVLIFSELDSLPSVAEAVPGEDNQSVTGAQTGDDNEAG